MVEHASWHTWSARPDEVAVRDQVEAFFQAVHAADMVGAFALCPIYTYGDPLLVSHDDADAVGNAIASMRETLLGYDYVDAGDPAWHARVTPPSRVDFAQLELALPQAEGDTLANVFIDDEVTDVTCIYALLERDGRWQLAFKMFKVM